jgi:hypothetical protein
LRRDDLQVDCKTYHREQEHGRHGAGALELRITRAEKLVIGFHD